MVTEKEGCMKSKEEMQPEETFNFTKCIRHFQLNVYVSSEMQAFGLVGSNHMKLGNSSTEFAPPR